MALSTLTYLATATQHPTTAMIEFGPTGSHKQKTLVHCFFFFFKAEDGIRDLIVTGVQTCALPISRAASDPRRRSRRDARELEIAHPSGTRGQAGIEYALSQLIQLLREPQHLPGGGVNRRVRTQRRRVDAGDVAALALGVHAPLDLRERGVGGLDRLRGGGLGWRTRLDRHPRAERHPQPSQAASGRGRSAGGRGRRLSRTHGTS